MTQSQDSVMKMIEEEHDRTPASVLIVDDEASITTVLTRSLETENYRLATAANGTTAIGEIEKTEFDVVITDIMMPGASGIAVLKRVKERYPETEVILITGHASVSSAAEAVRQGAADYILKPFENLQVIRLAVRRAVTRRRLVRLVRQYSTELQAANLRLKRQREHYENFEEVAHLCASRTIESIARLETELSAAITEPARLELDGVRRDNAELKELVERFLDSK